MKTRSSNYKTFKSFEPKGGISKLYQIAEKIRYEKIGSDKFKILKNNIQNIILIGSIVWILKVMKIK